MGKYTFSHWFWNWIKPQLLKMSGSMHVVCMSIQTLHIWNYTPFTLAWFHWWMSHIRPAFTDLPLTSPLIISTCLAKAGDVSEFGTHKSWSVNGVLVLEGVLEAGPGWRFCGIDQVTKTWNRNEKNRLDCLADGPLIHGGWHLRPPLRALPAFLVTQQTNIWITNDAFLYCEATVTPADWLRW